MYMWFWGYPPIIVSYFFPPLFRQFFPGPISIRIDILCAQLLSDFSTDYLDTMLTCSVWSEDVRVVLGLACRNLFSTFLLFFFQFLFSCDTMALVTCGRNSSYSSYQSFWNFAGVFVQVWRRACASRFIFPSFFFIIFFPFFRCFSCLDYYQNRYLVGATHPTHHF